MTYGHPMDGAQWLASCQRRPEDAYAAWRESPYLARLPAGKAWDALRVPQPLGLTVLWELGDLAEKVPVLEEHAKPRPVFYILTEPGTAADWPDAEDARMVSTGEDLHMPSPGADGITGVQHHSFLWRVPPDGSGRLADPDVLRTAVALARNCDRQAERVRAARAVFYASRRRGR
ncbi:hypothetical protein [Streptomyces beihaiensis]|uniref:Uncharacterized protein n=1 Tax=Streptomyces beihaiensis TaxID=2984495 RepID=A0ABT3U008_9ACTN|nr:hypothetical protein [Streptomyces beihaiensis]MCX3061630.1 hypothetical protein [Streptomyces beihaiensis]